MAGLNRHVGDIPPLGTPLLSRSSYNETPLTREEDKAGCQGQVHSVGLSFSFY